MSSGSFIAYASRLQAAVGIACFLPIVAAATVNLVFLPGAPVLLRLFGVLVTLPFLVWFAIAIRLIVMKPPVIEIDGSGLLWRRWSETRIPWDAVDRWAVKQTVGIPFATIWLRDTRHYPAATVQRLLRYGNRWLGYGDITMSTAGTDRAFGDLVGALLEHAPAPKAAARSG